MPNFFDSVVDEVATGFFGHSLIEYLEPGGGGPTLTPPQASPAPSNIASTYAEQFVRRQELLRKSLQSTIHAGASSWVPAGGQIGPGQTGAWPKVK